MLAKRPDWGALPPNCTPYTGAAELAQAVHDARAESALVHEHGGDVAVAHEGHGLARSAHGVDALEGAEGLDAPALAHAEGGLVGAEARDVDAEAAGLRVCPVMLQRTPGMAAVETSLAERRWNARRPAVHARPDSSAPLALRSE